MKKKILILSICSAVPIVAILLGTQSSASGSTPGTVDDPLVTKSYVDENVEKKVAELLSKMQNQTTPSIKNENQKTGNDLTIIQLQPNQSLYGGSGTEFIVRTGKVLVTSSDASGIADVTSGKDITAGQPVELNHLLIVPREGRGIKPDPKNKQDIFVMVRGSYSILNADGTMAAP